MENNEVSITTKKCLECNEEFTLTQTEVDWYKERDFKLPKRCQPCRKRRKKDGR